MGEAAGHPLRVRRGDPHLRRGTTFVAQVLDVARLRPSQRPLIQQRRVVRDEHRSLTPGDGSHGDHVVGNRPGTRARLPVQQASVRARVA